MLSVNIRKRPRDPRAATNRRARLSGVEPDAFTLDATFDAAAGVTILFGASGAGKSMTLRAIAGIVRPDAGHIRIGERTLFDSARAIDLPVRARRVGYVFQNLALFPHLSALGNVEFALDRLPRRERRERAFEMLEGFKIAHTAARRPRDISGGEAQRVALARALASEPQILLLDEPLSALDEATKREIISDLKTLNRRLQLPVLYVTHSREEAVALGERVVVYERGRVVAGGEPLQVFAAASPLSANVARLTGVENVFAGKVVNRHEEARTMTVEIAGDAGGACRLEVPVGGESVGAGVRVAVRSGDILLATSEPRDTSARNILRGRIKSIEETGAHVRVHVSTGGVGWIVSVTRQSVRELRLAREMEVWMAFKTYSCHLLDPE
ncbi:MAG TPA: molybdenum ABC transporter ATP-binding protein [Pyrinomonadaceae bacterium]|jgi:molybdate transport system ATP-binding protein|nr:molybdenum ABC transporter ATP-binding protein [Pyrinomonadaceae bacterium]